ncbi:hypothetical protein E2F46_00255 [Luteimonas aestuarii]|uniref:Uncharacterized protein n=1 Tax=Luteimonas aestuarii TaxID=453837 RepID=A0A4R5U3U0_9GAMM|nr:hypothetical protein [Luteimonas aestuarii]TDK28367.1 hypothetical protein E2F46_00255 [Luteimonas aestuarii]
MQLALACGGALRSLALLLRALVAEALGAGAIIADTRFLAPAVDPLSVVATAFVATVAAPLPVAARLLGTALWTITPGRFALRLASVVPFRTLAGPTWHRLLALRTFGLVALLLHARRLLADRGLALALRVVTLTLLVAGAQVVALALARRLLAWTIAVTAR